MYAKEKILLSEREEKEFRTCQMKLQTARSPVEARYYKNRIIALIHIGRTKYKREGVKSVGKK